MEPTWLGSMTADLGMDQRFFAIELHVGKDYRISASDDVELQLTHACLGPSTPAGVATCLQCTTFDDDDDSDDDEDGDGDADKTTAVLGRYKVGGRDNGQLEITLHDESVLLSLVGGVKGQSTLHLSGRMVLVPGLDDAATESAVRVVESSSRAGWTPTKEDPGLKRKADGSIDAVYTPDKKKPRKKPDGGDPVADAKAEAKKSGAKKEAERARTEKAKEKAAQQQPKVFTPSRKFAGARAGFVFKKGKKGVGYYPDVRPPTITAAQLKAIRKAPAEGRDPGQGGWQKGPSGLKFKTMRSGNGPKPKRGKSVKCRYLLRLSNDRGRIVDKSPPSGFSFRLGVGEVIKAWDLALADMRKGEKRALLVPPNLGYGARGAPPDIPARATLYFEVEHC